MDRRKILIVDDQVEALESIAVVFADNKLPYEIMKATNGNVALKLLERELPDLIITDWEMPVMDGIELIKRLKKDSRTVDIPVIMCTGIMTGSNNLETALQAGAVDYVRKPVDKVELIARTKANLHLADSYMKIKKLNESKNRILSIIAHDLRGPVSNIKSFLDLLLSKQSDYDSATLINYLSLLAKQSTAAYSILENLLVWAKAQQQNINFNPEKHLLTDAVETNIVLLESIAEKKNITIKNNVDKNITATFDLHQISTVIRNLLANAIKFTPENGTITINISQDEYQTVVSVSDTGVGIEPEKVVSIFDEATFNPTFGTNNEKGSGLGLKLCKYFVELHGGKIKVSSHVGKGSEFVFTIPAKIN